MTQHSAIDHTGITGVGGGGFTHSYIGYNTIGGTTESFTQFRWFIKKVTLASAGLIASVGAYVKQTTIDSVTAFSVGVFEDNAGTPRYTLALSSDAFIVWLQHSSGAVGDARWLHAPVGFYAAAGDYWIGFSLGDTSGTYQVYKDTSGTDRYFTWAANRVGDAGRVTVTTTTDRYSIRASLIS